MNHVMYYFAIPVVVKEMKQLEFAARSSKTGSHSCLANSMFKIQQLWAELDALKLGRRCCQRLLKCSDCGSTVVHCAMPLASYFIWFDCSVELTHRSRFLSR